MLAVSAQGAFAAHTHVPLSGPQGRGPDRSAVLAGGDQRIPEASLSRHEVCQKVLCRVCQHLQAGPFGRVAARKTLPRCERLPGP